MILNLLKTLLCTSLVILAACGATTEQQIDTSQSEAMPEVKADTTTESKPEETTNKNSEEIAVGETRQTQIGEMTLVKKLDVNETFTTGSFEIKISTIGVTNIIPNESSKAMFQGKDRATWLSIGMEVKNTSPDTLSFHPNQGVVVVGSEQKNADLLMSEDVGGDFIGEVIKKGRVLFVLDTLPDEVSSVKYVIDPPFSTTNYTGSLGEKLTLEFEIK